MNKILQESLKRIIFSAFMTALVTSVANKLVDKIFPESKSNDQNK